MSDTLAPDTSAGEHWISFLRGYGPVTKGDSMYAETVARQAERHGVTPLGFEHPEARHLAQVLDAGQGALTNVILTGTAGDGKTTLCNELWLRLTGDDRRKRGLDRGNYASTEVDTPMGPRTLHFIFEFSGFTPEQGQAWSPAQLSLLDRMAQAVLDENPTEFFVVAANDGKLVQAFESLPPIADRRLQPLIERMLTGDLREVDGARLLFLNMSRMSTRGLFERALDCLLARPEWQCFEQEKGDTAFSERSPLTMNFRLLKDPQIRERIFALGELCDANDFHISIREVLLFFVNGLLGCRSPDGVARPETLRELAREDRQQEARLYDNLLGANLTSARRHRFAVFRFLDGLRIGHETSNALDALILFGKDDEELCADHRRLVASDPFYGSDPAFARMRQAYLEAEDDRALADDFHAALIGERRRLFFRLGEGEERFNPWHLSVFHNAGTFRREILTPLRKGAKPASSIKARLVQGLNRIWTGMLVGALDELFLTTGLDFTTARVSDLFLATVPLEQDFNGAGIELAYDADRGVPLLCVDLKDGHRATLRLTLTRFEFLMRVAKGALPSSFSKECYEDIISFKTRVLADFYRHLDGRPVPLSIVTASGDGALGRRQLGIRL